MQRKSFDAIYQSYIQDIFRYLFFLCHDYHQAEDLVNETFYRAYLFLEECQDEKVKPWLFKVAYHAYVDFRRKNSKVLLKDTAYFESLGNSETPEGLLIAKEQLEEIQQVIAGLPENQKQAVLLCDFQGFQYKEAAEIMQVSVGHFKVLLFRARQKIRSEKTGSE